MNLRETREYYNLSQLQAASIVNVPVRTFRRYELNEAYGDVLKRKMFIKLINDCCEITESKGILTIDHIKETITNLFDSEYKDKIDFCFLFGSYAKGNPKDDSDIDLYVYTSLTGLDFVGLIERLRQSLHKKVDVVRSSELKNNIELVNEIMHYGVKVYSLGDN